MQKTPEGSNAALPPRLLEENRSVLSNFLAKGVDLKKSRVIEFRMSLEDKASCVLARKTYKEKYKTPKSGMFIVINDPENYELLLSVEIVPTAENVTDIENKLLDVATEFKDADVYWGFED